MKALLKISGSSPLGPTREAAVLEWLATRLPQLGLTASPVSPRAPVGRSLAVTVFEERYSLTLRRREATTESEPQTGDTVAWLELKKRRGAVDWLLGRNGFDGDDAFLRILLDVLDRELWVDEVNLSWL